jgi:hypothetical protein
MAHPITPPPMIMISYMIFSFLFFEITELDFTAKSLTPPARAGTPPRGD